MKQSWIRLLDRVVLIVLFVLPWMALGFALLGSCVWACVLLLVWLILFLRAAREG